MCCACEWSVSCVWVFKYVLKKIKKIKKEEERREKEKGEEYIYT
jgi:hypothetical protein